jgi:hypothetical protein
VLELPPLPPPATGVPVSANPGATPATPIRPAMRMPPRPLPVPPQAAIVPPPGATTPPPANLQVVEEEDPDSEPAPDGEARR